ncbi:MAG: hypothetical protein IPN69_04545 [Acidobacteria bacterium]|nr:hypothetical protein [Acidobacteriota bacterium]MBK8150232.1 hypothetical protein [Acidobacteriota bacterium]MBK8809982.1 hypothetical protein [Acidobacteriota bacterium]
MTNRDAKSESREFLEAVTAVLFRHDPAALNFGFNPEEYRPEAETIVYQLEACRSEEAVLEVIERELFEWFDEATADGPEVPAIAAEVWKLIEERNL